MKLNNNQRKLLFARLVRKEMIEHPTLPIRTIKVIANDHIVKQGHKPIQKYKKNTH